LPANEEVLLENIRGNTMEIVAEIAPQQGQTFELNVLRSPDGNEVTRIICMRDRGYRRIEDGSISMPCVVVLDASRSSQASNVKLRPPETAQVELTGDEPLKLRIFIDRSVVEVFVNNKQCVALRVYPERDDSNGVSLRSYGQDSKLVSLKAYQMKNIYQ
jgi:beta-fructofuranosidase